MFFEMYSKKSVKIHAHVCLFLLNYKMIFIKNNYKNK